MAMILFLVRLDDGELQEKNFNQNEAEFTNQSLSLFCQVRAFDYIYITQ
jgi:hypothetical protein